jgi:hypothetical protein
MALHLKKDFAKMCGLTTGNLTVYITRKKVIASGDYIDDSILTNQEFLVKRRNAPHFKSEGPVFNPPKLRAIKPDTTLPEVPNVVNDDEEDEVSDDDFEKLLKQSDNLGELFKVTTDLEKKKTIVEIQKKRKEISLLTIREEKFKGILIPTDLIRTLIQQHSRSTATEFKNSIDSILTKISKKKDLSVTEQAELRGELLDVINKTVDKSVDLTEKLLGRIVNEFIEKRDVGERS